MKNISLIIVYIYLKQNFLEISSKQIFQFYYFERKLLNFKSCLVALKTTNFEKYLTKHIINLIFLKMEHNTIKIIKKDCDSNQIINKKIKNCFLGPQNDMKLIDL